MMKWAKIGKVAGAEGTTIIYRLEGTPYTVESRKRAIPHANGVGTWPHTSYFVLKDGEQITEKYMLKHARELAEALYKRDREGGNHG